MRGIESSEAVAPEEHPPLSKEGSYWVPALLVLAGGVALSVDLPLAQWCVAGKFKALDRLLAWSELFAHGLGVGLILLVIVVLDPPKFFKLGRVIAASLGAGAVSNLFKLFIARARPRACDFGQGVFDTFFDWGWRVSLENHYNSFPSGHATTSAGLAVALVWLYPRGRYLFPALACLAATQRVDSGAHFLSDVLVGAALGTCCAMLVTRDTVLGRLFDRLEAKVQGVRLQKPAGAKLPLSTPSLWQRFLRHHFRDRIF